MLPLVIINPASAGGATGAAWPGLASVLRQHFGAFNCAHTERAGDGASIAEREAREGRAFIIACGGDGTINEVANGILRSGADAELGVLPSGTGGDFRRTLRISQRASEAARALRQGTARRIDAGRVTFRNQAGAEETRYFLNVASCGMAGAVVERVTEKNIKRLPAMPARLFGGRAAFAAATLQTTFEFTKPTVELRFDDGAEFRLVVTNLCIANARYFGGGMKIAPEARLDDGLFDVVAVGDMSALSILANSYRIYLGTHLGMRQVRHTHARTVHARTADGSPPVMLEIDGELAGHLPATFEIMPRALRVRSDK
ncbi:MAG TPA: diacylglycerol kinase family protein [Pyrinomonadaceae bacterium]|jgi:YegS/Rv2252/BmrU family lipid kinase|nr:diacylglycerol kinase family protein [Pyrinomonadaceae bacterium]